MKKIRLTENNIKAIIAETFKEYIIEGNDYFKRKGINEDEEYLSPSWLNGKYSNIRGYNVEINSALSIASFDDVNDPDNSYFFQGDEADAVIGEINDIYNRGDMNQGEAIARWISNYL